MTVWQRPVRRVISGIAAIGLVGAAGMLLSSCDTDEPTESSYNRIQQVTVRPETYGIRVGNSLPLLATATGVNSAILAGKKFTWNSSNASVATVTETGLVTGVSVGNVKINATSEGFTATASIEILPPIPLNFSIVDAQFTQGAQALDGSIPMVLNGGAAVLNVMIGANDLQTAASVQVVLRMFNANNTLVRTDTARTGTLYLTTPTTGSPTAQFLVPASALQSGMRWQVERDPRHQFTDADAADDVYPRTGTAALNVTDVPALPIRFVPIALTAHGVQAVVSASGLTDFTRTLESVMPIGAISRTIAAPLATNAFFGAQQRGGDSPFWMQILGELDLARVVDVERAAYWVGVVIPPQGYTSTIFGGFGYIPTNGAQTGAASRTSVLVGPGWYSSQVAARDGLAHEMGHNFGRRHAPCGTVASGVDPSYPFAIGNIGFPGHDVYAWSKGFATSAAVVPGETGDVMGYCARPWVSSYTYSGALSFRRSGIVTAALAPQEARQRVLIVRGSITDRQSAVLEPAFVTTAVPTAPDAIGPYRLEGLDVQGRVLFARSFATAELDHAPSVGQFLFAIPATSAIETALATLRVIVPGQATTQRISAVARNLASLNSATSASASVSRNSEGSVTVVCQAPYTSGTLVRERDGALLSTSATNSTAFVAVTGTPLSISCSDGVRSINVESVAQ